LNPEFYDFIVDVFRVGVLGILVLTLAIVGWDRSCAVVFYGNICSRDVGEVIDLFLFCGTIDTLW
jgi:hypothetical protein